jgi:hypothetical protein
MAARHARQRNDRAYRQKTQGSLAPSAHGKGTTMQTGRPSYRTYRHAANRALA